MEYISIETAIKKALRIRAIFLLIALPFFLPFGITLTLKGYSGAYALGGMILCLIVCLIIGFIYFTLALQHWRIWAFTHVRNVHQLRKIASEYLFVPRNKLFYKTELHPVSYKEKWKALQYRFDTPDEVLEDITLPHEVMIRKNYIYMILTSRFCLGIVLFIICITLLRSIWILPLFYLIASFFCFVTDWKNFKRLFDSSMYLQFDTYGMRTGKNQFYSWNEITKEYIVPVYKNSPREFKPSFSWDDIAKDDKEFVYIGGYQRYNALCFTVAGEEKIVILDDYKTNRFKLLNIIQTFRIRHNRSKLV